MVDLREKESTRLKIEYRVWALMSIFGTAFALMGLIVYLVDGNNPNALWIFGTMTITFFVMYPLAIGMDRLFGWATAGE
jgi:hypothetical protein